MRLFSGFLFTIIFVAVPACSTGILSRNGIEKTPSEAISEPSSPKKTRSYYAGRISLTLEAQSDTAKNYSGSFELRGSPESGQLDLLSPFGQKMAQLQWGSGFARLQTAGQTPEASQEYSSFEAMLQASAGLSISAKNLFAWLNGQPVPAEQSAGWVLDFSNYAAGKISARRAAPEAAQLRIVLEEP